MAYGAIAAPKLTEELPIFAYPLPGDQELLTYAVHGQTSEKVMDYLEGVFMAELEGEFTSSCVSRPCEG